MLDEVGSCGGEQGVGGEVAVGQAGNLLEYGLEQVVPPLVMLRLVRAGASAIFQCQREAPVVDFEAEDGIEQGGDAILRWGRGPEWWRAGLDGLPDRFEPRLVQRAEQSGAIPEARKSVPLPTPASEATAAMVMSAGLSVRAKRASAAASTASRLRAASLRDLCSGMLLLCFAKRTRGPYRQTDPGSIL